MIKVKSHSGDHYNDIADELAKAGCTKLPLDLDLMAYDNLQLIANFNQIPIEFSIRKFWKNLNATKQFSAFMDLNRNSQLI